MVGSEVCQEGSCLLVQTSRNCPPCLSRPDQWEAASAVRLLYILNEHKVMPCSGEGGSSVCEDWIQGRCGGPCAEMYSLMVACAETYFLMVAVTHEGACAEAHSLMSLGQIPPIIHSLLVGMGWDRSRIQRDWVRTKRKNGHSKGFCKCLAAGPEHFQPVLTLSGLGRA